MNMKRFTRYLIIILVTIVVAVGVTRVIQQQLTSILSKQTISNDSSQKKSPPVVQYLEGFYFGISDSRPERQAWFLYLDTKSGTGSCYDSPNLEVSHVELSPSGRITFQLNLLEKEYLYVFEGKVASNGFDGQLHLLRLTDTSHEELHCHNISFQKLDSDDWRENKTGQMSGLYSNVYLHEETGDLLGEELLLIPTREEMLGIYVLYEGRAGNSQAIRNAQLFGHKIRFKVIQSDGKEQSYERLLSNQKSSQKLNESVLHRRRNLFELMTPTPAASKNSHRRALSN